MIVGYIIDENKIKELKRMGKGWFILKCAEEKGLIDSSLTYYGTNKAMKIRLNQYKKSSSYHDQLLSFIFYSWSKRISAGLPVLDNTYLYELASKMISL